MLRQPAEAAARAARLLEYYVYDALHGSGLLAQAKSPVQAVPEFLSEVERQTLLAQLPADPTQHLRDAMRSGTAKLNDGKGVSMRVNVPARLTRRLRELLFATQHTRGPSKPARLPVLISVGCVGEHRDRFVSADGWSPDKLVKGYACFLYLAGGAGSTLFFRHDTGRVEAVPCTPGKLIVFKNLAVRHWVEGPVNGPARVMLGPMAFSPRQGEIQQITAMTGGAGAGPGLVSFFGMLQAYNAVVHLGSES